MSPPFDRNLLNSWKTEFLQHFHYAREYNRLWLFWTTINSSLDSQLSNKVKKKLEKYYFRFSSLYFPVSGNQICLHGKSRLKEELATWLQRLQKKIAKSGGR